MKSVLDHVLGETEDKSFANKILIAFLSADFSDDRFGLVEYAKKSSNYIWEQKENGEEIWKAAQFDFIDRISKCQNVEILQHAFKKACKI